MPENPLPAGREPTAAERDAETARLLRAGDPEGLRRLVEDHGSRVRGTLRMDFKLALDHAEIDDAFNQAAHRVWKARERIDLQRGTLRAWLYSIARNCALRLIHAKRKPGTPRIVDDLDAVGGATLPAREAGGRERLGAAVRTCIEGLPPMQRAVLLADLAAGGIADTQMLVQQLDSTPNAIYVARTNGRKAVRAALQSLGHPAAGGPAKEKADQELEGT